MNLEKNSLPLPNMGVPSYDDLPRIIEAQQRQISLLFEMFSNPENAPDRFFTINELIEYLPGEPAKSTIYGKVNRREIPYMKRGKHLIFSKKSIDEWLVNSSVKPI